MLGYKSARIRELEQRLAAAEQHAQMLADARAVDPILLNIRRDGRALVMTFQRGDERFTFETYSTMASDVKGLLQWANIG